MARYKFTRKDLAPLRAFLDLPLARDVVNAAVPVKRLVRAELREEATLAVEVLSRDHANGVPLDAILQEVQKTAPTATGIVVRGGKVIISHSTAPKPQERAKLQQLLGDAPKLEALRPTETLSPGAVRPTDALSPGAVRPTPRRAAKPKDVRAVLLDESTPDAEWLQAFRRWAIDNLLKER